MGKFLSRRYRNAASILSSDYYENCSKAFAGLTFAAIAICLTTANIEAIAQVAQQTNAGSSHLLTFSTSTTYGVSSSASSTPGVVATSDATLKLLPNSGINNAIDCSQTNCTASFSSNGYGMSSSDAGAIISGLKASNAINIDPSSTSFSSKVDTTGGTSTVLNKGDASASINASLSATVQEVKSSFTNSLQQAF